MIISKKVEFSASHICRSPQLSEEENRRIYGAACNPNGHGHNYIVEVAIEGRPDPVTGMILDLKRLKELLEEHVLSAYDHRLLNVEVKPFDTVVPTVENIAFDIWNRLEPRIASETPARLNSVRVHETGELYAEYRGESMPQPAGGDPIPSRRELTPDEQRVEAAVNARVEANLPEYVNRYRAQYGDVFSSDKAATLFPEYNESPQTRLRYRAAVTGASHAIADAAFLERIAESDRTSVSFVVGGPGAGKTTTAVNARARGHIVFDGSLIHAENLIRHAVKTGRRVFIQYVHRDPVDAFGATLHRAMNSETERGRVIPLRLHVSLHVLSAMALERLRLELRTYPAVIFKCMVNHTGEPSRASSVEEIAETDYTGLHERLERKLAEHLRSGAISRDVHDRVRQGPGTREALRGTHRSHDQDPDREVGGVPARRERLQITTPRAYLARRYSFTAAHRLHSPALSEEENRATYGKCNNPFGHGHDYEVELRISGPIDRTTGRILPLTDLDSLAEREIVSRFAYTDLNRELSSVPTTENLASELLARVRTAWPPEFPARLESISIWETDRNICRIDAHE